MDNSFRFYENYDAIRKFVISDTELTREGEILALSDLIYNTRTEKVNKKGQEIDPVIELLSKTKKTPLKVRRQAIKRSKQNIRKLVQALILKHLENDDNDELLEATSI